MRRFFILMLIVFIFSCKEENISYISSSWRTFNYSKSGLRDKNISVILLSGSSVWLASADEGGIAYNNQDQWENYTSTNTACDKLKNITDMVFDAFGNLWIGTRNGLIKYDFTTWTGFDVPGDNNITDLEVEGVSNIWICTQSGGIAVLNISSDTLWTVYTDTNSFLPTNNINCIVIDKANNKWIGTNDSGLIKYNANQYTVYNSLNSSLTSNSIKNLCLDNDDYLWITTADMGLFMFNKSSTWETYDIGIQSTISSITVDKNDYLWITTMGSGLIKFLNNSWFVYTTNNSGLIDDSLNTVVYNSSTKEKWIGTKNNGVIILK